MSETPRKAGIGEYVVIFIIVTAFLAAVIGSIPLPPPPA